MAKIFPLFNISYSTTFYYLNNGAQPCPTLGGLLLQTSTWKILSTLLYSMEATQCALSDSSFLQNTFLGKLSSILKGTNPQVYPSSLKKIVSSLLSAGREHRYWSFLTKITGNHSPQHKTDYVSSKQWFHLKHLQTVILDRTSLQLAFLRSHHFSSWVYLPSFVTLLVSHCNLCFIIVLKYSTF